MLNHKDCRCYSLGCNLLVFLFLCSPVMGAWAQNEPVYVFDDVNVIDVITGEVKSKQCVVIQGKLIQSVGSRPETELPDDATYVSSQGWYVIPGLYEMHAHIPPESASDKRKQDVLRLYLANGITTVRGMLGEPWHLTLRKELADGQRTGPRLITSGPSFNGRTVSSAKQARQRVKEQVDAGYDFIKLHPGLGPLEYNALVEEAKKLDIPFAGHVSNDVGLGRTLNAGQSTIDHLDGYAQRLLAEDSPLQKRDPGFFGIAIANGLRVGRISHVAKQTAKAGVWNVPTQSLMENILGTRSIAELMSRPEMIYVDAATKAQWRRSVESLRAEYSEAERLHFINIRRILIAALHDAGAGLLLGSDAPQIMNVPGFSIHDELFFMVESGLTPLQALQMGTSNPARFFNEENQRGQVAPGFRAELVFLSQNPLEDITHTRQIEGVFHHGEWFAREALSRWLTAAESH